MGSAIGLRDDFDGPALRRLARGSKSANQARRLLALAQIYDGGSRSEAAKIGGVTLQIVRDWVIRFNARGPDGLLDGKAPGKPSILDDAQRRALRKLGYVKLTARPRHHAQNELAMEAFKKGASLPSWRRSGRPSRRAHP